ncbi:MAG: fibronectin type III domain-containing protein [Acidobacteriota bacterium]
MSRRAIFAMALLLAASPLLAATQGGPLPVPLPLFPANNWWNTDISAAPVDSNSANFINFINTPPSGPTNRPLHPDFGGDASADGIPGDVYGFPVIIVNGSQTKQTVQFVDTPGESDGVNHPSNVSFPFYPIPSEAITSSGWVEGGQPGNVEQRSIGDRHILIVDSTNNTLYELYNVFYNGANWEASSGAFFDMNTNNRRPDTWTSADASGMAILPGLVRYDEVNSPGEILHALRVTVRATNGYVFPASHSAGSTSSALPLGARLRLKASTDLSTFPADVQKIFRAFKKYGLIVTDNGSDMYVSGTYDLRWDNGVLNPKFGSLHASDFEVIQRGWAPSVSLVLTLPAAMGSGDPTDLTVTAYDANYNVATGYRGTIHFTATDGSATIPVNYTFTAGDGGVHVFPAGVTLRTAGSQLVTATDIVDATITGVRGVTVGPPAPVNLVAAATTGTQVNLTWNPSPGGTQYEVVRATTLAGGYATVTTTASTSFSDATVTAGNTYVYKVRASDSSARLSPFSIPDAATTLFFTNDPLVPNLTVVKAIHLTELRQGVNAMRTAAGLGNATVTDSVLSSSVRVKAIHIQELRTALSQARSALGLPAATFTDVSLVAGTTKVKAAHVQELRNAIK